MERGSGLYDPRPGSHLWHHRNTSIVRHGHSGQTAPALPWQNGFAERLIGSIRRECSDHVVVLGEADLRRIIRSYVDYYNSVRTSVLKKDAPVSRPVQRALKSLLILGGLHHPYVRI
jgi:Integrase core domain